MFTSKETATILAALRYFQSNCTIDPTDAFPEQFAEVDPLDFDGDGPESINSLCERINCAPPDNLLALAAALERMLKVQEALMPGVRYIAVQDYAELNDAPIAARHALTAFKGNLT